MNKFNLTQVSKLLKSEPLLIVLGTLSITIFTVSVLSFAKRGKAPPPPPPGTPWQQSIYAGQTTKNELEAKLGSPQKIEQLEDGIAYQYPTDDEFRPNKVEIKGDTVSIIKQQVLSQEGGDLNDYSQKYGTPNAKLYGKYGTIAPGHFWGDKGLLVFGNDQDSTIVEIWYFAPTTLESFLEQNPQIKTAEPHNF